jgi:hypothetical protein
MTQPRYALVTAARNEEAFIEQTIGSVVAQSVIPARWIIVNDSSTDRTEQLVVKHASRHPFIRLITMPRDGKRHFGAQVRAINFGCAGLRQMPHEFIGNLDADISLDTDYYEKILRIFDVYPRLGLAGGFLLEDHGRGFVNRPGNSARSVAHGIQLFRRECFEAIGGYVPLAYGGADWYAEIKSRMCGWEVRSFPEVTARHLRHTASVGGSIRGRFRQGMMDHSLGSHPAFEIVKCLSRLKYPPRVLGGLSRICGFVWAGLTLQPRLIPAQAVRYLRQEQLHRLFSSPGLLRDVPAGTDGEPSHQLITGESEHP